MERITAYDRAYRMAWVHYWRRQWYNDIIRKLRLTNHAHHKDESPGTSDGDIR